MRESHALCVSLLYNLLNPPHHYLCSFPFRPSLIVSPSPLLSPPHPFFSPYPHSQTRPFRHACTCVSAGLYVSVDSCYSSYSNPYVLLQLLCIDVQKRISCLAELQDLDYMSNVNWDAVLSKHLPPGFIPNVSIRNKLSPVSACYPTCTRSHVKSTLRHRPTTSCCSSHPPFLLCPKFGRNAAQPLVEKQNERHYHLFQSMQS